MANPRRIKRLEQLILETSAQFIQRELQDPRIGLVTLTRVKLSPDLSRCRLYWSCLGEESQRRTTERGLEDALASIQRAVAGAMQTRVTPKLSLQYDPSLAQAERLETIFTQLREERGEDPRDASEEEGEEENAEGADDSAEARDEPAAG